MNILKCVLFFLTFFTLSSCTTNKHGCPYWGYQNLEEKPVQPQLIEDHKAVSLKLKCIES